MSKLQEAACGIGWGLFIGAFWIVGHLVKQVIS